MSEKYIKLEDAAHAVADAIARGDSWYAALKALPAIDVPVKEDGPKH